MAIKICQAINLLNRTVAYTTSLTGGLVYITPSNFNDTLTWYFEGVSGGTGSSSTAWLLRNSADTTTYATATFTAANQRQRASIASPPSSATEFAIKGSSGNRDIAAARILIIQSATDTLTATETQIEIGNYQTAITSTAAVALTYPKYWYYDSSKFDGAVAGYAEAVYAGTSSKYTYTITLQYSTDLSAWSTDTVIVNAGTATVATRVRVSFTPTNGRNYRIVCQTSSTKGSLTIYGAKIVVKQQDKLSCGTQYFGSSADLFSSSAIKIAQSFDGTGQALTSVKFYLKKTGSPSGNAVAVLYDHTGTFGVDGTPTGAALTTSNNFDVSTLTTSWQLIEFTGLSYTPTSGTKYCISLEYNGGSGLAYISAGLTPASSTFHEGNYSVYISSWDYNSSFDIIFYLNSYGFTKTECVHTVLNTGSNATGLQNKDIYYYSDTTEWDGCTKTVYHEIDTTVTSTAAAKLQSDPNGTPADITNSAVTASAVRTRGGTALTMPSSNEIDTNITNNGSGYITHSKLIFQVVVSTATYKDFSGTGGLSTSTPNADIIRLANYTGAAALVTATPNADLPRLANYTGAAAVASATPSVDINRYANFTGTAALVTATPDADLSINIFKDYAGTAALVTATPDADLSLLAPATYQDFSGLAALATATPDADLMRLANLAGAAALVSATPDADLPRLSNFTGLAALATVAPDADLQRWGELAGLAALVTATPDADLSINIFKDYAGTAALITATPDADLHRLANLAGTAALASAAPDADLSRYTNFTGLAALATVAPDADLSLLAPPGYQDFTGTAALATATPDADLMRLANLAGAAALATAVPGADLSRYANFTGTAALATAAPDADLNCYANLAGEAALISATVDAEIKRWVNYQGTAALDTFCPEADLSLLIYRDFIGLAALLTAALDAELQRWGELAGLAALETTTPDADLRLLGGFYQDSNNWRANQPPLSGKHTDDFARFGVNPVLT